ncbi:unnamed protein product [Cuscuta campestris]|uniref:Peptidase A1 domain-containing protein n=1 Tax=Cuscuta campestris TaxID=132261 RepID=A0A484M4I9_9ASTE|nr:unnamed protein product [Cuscuta campestris]
MQLENQFRTTKKGSLSISAYCQTLKNLADWLDDVDAPVSKIQLVLQVLWGLPDDMRRQTSFLQFQTPPPTFLQTRSALLLLERQQSDLDSADPSPGTALFTAGHTGAHPHSPAGRGRGSFSSSGGRGHSGSGGSRGRGARVSGKANRLSQEDAGGTDLPAESGLSLSTLSYVVNVSIGSPATTLSLVFDTGSPITWTQCRPCVKECYPQKLSIFDPRGSKTYSNVSCSSPLCSALGYLRGNCSSATCVYGIGYGDGSYTVGYFAKERLSLTPPSSDTFDNFFFGCGQKNNGLFGNVSGLLGLSPGKFSVVSQTAKVYDKIFSYCLPTQDGNGGYLEFGNRDGINNNKLIRFTPLTKVNNDTSLYYIQLQSISVGGERLQIEPAVFSNVGTIIDSGTVITRLPPDAYKALKSAFAGHMMMKHYTKAQNFSLFDTCFDFSKIGSGGNITYPKIEFHFSGDVTVEIPSTGILLAIDKELTQVCLAFAGNEKPDDVGIFGNTQHQTLDVVYDVKKWRLGFGEGRGRCT